jgi:copper chaperone CopZ
MSQRHFTVTGMSCEHCATGIKKEVTGVAGVTGVTVDVAANSVTVEGALLDDSLLRAAIEEAGCTVTGSVTA